MCGSRSELASTFRTWEEGEREERREASQRRVHVRREVRGGGRGAGSISISQMHSQLLDGAPPPLPPLCTHPCQCPTGSPHLGQSVDDALKQRGGGSDGWGGMQGGILAEEKTKPMPDPPSPPHPLPHPLTCVA